MSTCLLIVDDEPDYLAELVEALAFNDILAVSVASGSDALEILRREPAISIVLTDIRMPDIDGVAMIEAAKAQFPARALRFVVMTGHAAPVDVDRAKAAGATECFPKPLAFDDLCDTLVQLHRAGYVGG